MRNLGLFLLLSSVAACGGASSKGNGITACTVVAEDASSAAAFAVGNDANGYTAFAYRTDGGTLVELSIPNAAHGSLGTYARYNGDGTVIASATIDLSSGSILSANLRLDDQQLLALIESRTMFDSAIGDSSRVGLGLDLFGEAAARPSGPTPFPSGDSSL